jgi:hypothetical protein
MGRAELEALGPFDGGVELELGTALDQGQHTLKKMDYLHVEVTLSRQEIVRSIRPIHPFTYRGSSQASHNVHVIPPIRHAVCSKSKCNDSSHLLVPLEALDRDRLESLVLRSELSLPGLELASNGAEDVKITHWHSCSYCCSTSRSSSRCPCLLHAFYLFFSSSQGATLGRRVRLRQ